MQLLADAHSIERSQALMQVSASPYRQKNDPISPIETGQFSEAQAKKHTTYHQSSTAIPF